MIVIKYLVTLFLLVSVQISSAQFVPDVFAKVSIASQSDPVEAGAPLNLTVTASNTSGAFIATGVSVEIQLPVGASDVISPECIESSTGTLICQLAELGPGEVVEFDLTVSLSVEGHQQFVARLSGDNLVENGNTLDSEIVLVEVEEPNLSPVNLAVEISGIAESVSLSDPSSQVTLTVHNLSDTSTAVAPLVETTIPETYGFFSGDDCSVLVQIVTCRVAALAAGDLVTLTFLLSQNDVDDEATIVTSVSSTQPELDLSDNITQVVTSITPFRILCGASNPTCSGGEPVPVVGPDADEEPDSNTAPDTNAVESGPAVSEANSGGGTIGLFILVLLAIFLRHFICRRIPCKAVHGLK